MNQNYLTDLITDNINDGIIIIDNNSIITHFNPSAVRFSGIDRSLVVGKNFSAALKFIVEEGPKVNNLINDTLSGHGSLLNHQAIMVCPGNIDLPIIYRLIAITDQNENISGCLFVFRDDQLDRYKTDYLSIVAHQLKTPLGSMRWNLESLLTSTNIINHSATIDIVRDIYNSNSRLISMVNDLLNASRIDARKVIIKPEPTDILTVINSTLKELTYQIQQKQLTVNLQTISLPTVIIDPDHLRQVFENLLSNAIKYNRLRGAIDIITSNQNSQITITIKDSGIGISNSELPQIFSRSFRAQNAVDTQIDGSGLGLYVAKSYVEDWGGQITCQSEINRGTTITFSIPSTIKPSNLNKNLAI